MHRLVFSPEAGRDTLASDRWHAAQRPGLGAEFRQAIEAITSRIRRNPESLRTVSDHFHRALLRRFPFEVFYEFDDERVVVHVVFHTSQAPDKWRARLGFI